MMLVIKFKFETNIVVTQRHLVHLKNSCVGQGSGNKKNYEPHGLAPFFENEHFKGLSTTYVGTMSENYFLSFSKELNFILARSTYVYYFFPYLFES